MDDGDLPRQAANHVPLSPISFLLRAARIYPNRTAVIHGARRYTYAQMAERSRRLASALNRAGVAPGDMVAILAPNTPEMLEAHYGVPMTGAVLDGEHPAGCRGHRLHPAACRAKLLLVDREFARTIAPRWPRWRKRRR